MILTSHYDDLLVSHMLLSGLTKVLAQRLKVLNQAMTGPSWITVTVLSKNLHNFKIWFSDDDQQQHKAVEEDDGVMGTNPLFIIVGAIIMCCGGLIGALICFFKVVMRFIECCFLAIAFKVVMHFVECCFLAIAHDDELTEARGCQVLVRCPFGGRCCSLCICTGV